MRRMAMGKRKSEPQPTMWVTTTDLPTAVSHPFYARLKRAIARYEGGPWGLSRALLKFSGGTGDLL